MKKKLYKNISIRFFITILLLCATFPLLAAKYSEPRKVLVSKYNNALYRNFAVLGTMTLSVDNPAERTFIMEVGKRPSYFWNSSKSFHFSQEQTMDIEAISYSGGSASDLLIDTIDIPYGFLLSSGITLKDSNVSLSNDDASLLVGFVRNLPLTFDFDNSALGSIGVYSDNLIFVANSGETNLPISSLSARDLSVIAGGTEIRFPSPRSVITEHQQNGVIVRKASGTARDFELVTLGNTIHSYYGPWENVGAPAVTISSSACGESAEDRCYRSQVYCQNNSKPCNEPGLRIVFDTDTEIFECAGEVLPDDSREYVLGNYYDANLDQNPSQTCYDYQIVTSPVIFNYIREPYEFKVQEIFLVTGNPQTATIISQTPKFRTLTADSSLVPISKSLVSNWDIFESNKIDANTFTVNGNNYTNISKMKKISDITLNSSLESRKGTNPCLWLCEGHFCNTPLIYIRDRKTRVLTDTDAADITNYWPATDGEKNKILEAEYTVGLCPAISETVYKEYSRYEINNDRTNLSVGKERIMNSFIISNGANNYAAPEICMKRKVKCNTVSGSLSKNYKPLSTDY